MVLLKDRVAAKEHLRTKVRVDLHVPVVFEWRDIGVSGAKCHAPGFTRNVSPEGLYVLSEISPPAQVVARCRLVLPPLQALNEELDGLPAARGEASASYDHCEQEIESDQADNGYEAVVIGRVIRTEAISEEQVGFAVQARVMILREFDLSLMS